MAKYVVCNLNPITQTRVKGKAYVGLVPIFQLRLQNGFGNNTKFILSFQFWTIVYALFINQYLIYHFKVITYLKVQFSIPFKLNSHPPFYSTFLEVNFSTMVEIWYWLLLEADNTPSHPPRGREVRLSSTKLQSIYKFYHVNLLWSGFSVT